MGIGRYRHHPDAVVGIALTAGFEALIMRGNVSLFIVGIRDVNADPADVGIGDLFVILVRMAHAEDEIPAELFGLLVGALDKK